jgi:hypothetical protein
MFRNLITIPATEPADVSNLSDLVPLSVLELDLDAPVIGVPVLTDDIGRPSVSREVARQLITEQRERREAQARQRVAAELRAVEADRRWRAQLPAGIPASAIPDGVLPVMAMTQAVHDERPKRLTPLQEALSNSGELTFHSLAAADDES